MKNAIAKHRIKISKYLAVLVIVYYLLGASFWSLKNAILGDLLFFTGTSMVAVGVLGRAWCLSHIGGNKRNILIQHGPYSLCRNPLYLFSLVGAIGIGMTTKTLAFPLIIAILFAAYYPLVIRKEENELKSKFGIEFENYMRKTPSRIIPSLGGYRGLERMEVNLRSYRKGIFELIFFMVPIGIFPLIESLHAAGAVPFIYIIY